VIGHRLFGQAQQIRTVMPALRGVFFHASGSCRFVDTGSVRRCGRRCMFIRVRVAGALVNFLRS